MLHKFTCSNSVYRCLPTYMYMYSYQYAIYTYQLWGPTHLMHCVYGNHNTRIAICSACMAIEYQIQTSIQQKGTICDARGPCLCYLINSVFVFTLVIVLPGILYFVGAHACLRYNNHGQV